MRVAQLLTRVRDFIDEATSNVYTDVELVRALDSGVYDMFRLQAQHDESWHNCEHDISASSDSRVLHSDITLYDIPTWVHKITSVRITGATSAARGLNIPARTLHNTDGSFWAYHGFNRIMVHGNKAGDDLTLEVSKIPSPMNAGTIAADTTNFAQSTTVIQWDQASTTQSLYEQVYEEDWYKNSIFEFTGVDTTATEITGEVTRGLASSNQFDTTDTKTLTRVVFDKAVSRTPVSTDTWEMHAEVNTASVGYLIALAAHKAFIRKSNFEAIAALAADLERERARFIEAVTPRQDQVLPYAGMWTDPLYDRDLDRDESW